MRFRYSYFISYPHGQGGLLSSFVDELTDALRAYTEPYSRHLGVCVDRTLLSPGIDDTYVDKVIAEAICRSLSLVAVYSPSYFDEQKPYCAREFRAMEESERTRNALFSTHGLKFPGAIIPIILRRPSILPPAIASRNPYDFSQYDLGQRRLKKSRVYVPHIRQIADRIYRMNEDFGVIDQDPCLTCGSTELPSAADVAPWLSGLRPARLGLPTREVAA